MRIEQIDIKNYRLFRDVTLFDLPQLVVVVGANGAGKSTLFDVFSFLKDALTQNVASAVAKRGGFQTLVSRGHTGPIEIAIKFRESQGRLATYMLSVGLDESNRTVVDREVLRYRRGQHGKPWHFLDFRRGSGAVITNEAAYGHEGVQQEREEYTLESPDVLAIKGLGQFEKFRVVAELRRLIEHWRIEHPSARRDDVAQAAQYMHEQHRDRFDRLVARFRDGDFEDPFVSRYVSDGTIKMFAYLILLHDPRPRPLLAVEGPENQLHPDLLRELSEEFRLYTKRGGQVFIPPYS